MKLLKPIYTLVLCSLLLGGCRQEANLEISLSPKFDGKDIELVSFADSTLITTARLENGCAAFTINESDSLKFPFFAQLQVDGRTRAYYIIENGDALITDSTSVATGTPLNDRFSRLLASLDSVEALDDMERYISFSEEKYNENRDNVFGQYFAIEWVKYADPAKVDSMLLHIDDKLARSRRMQHYRNFARHRAETAPGRHYVDFEGENAYGKPITLSSLVTPGEYTLVDFWASWCPYCIKDLPQLVSIYEDLHAKGVNVVGVAVRDKPFDTKAMVKKQSLPYPVLYNTQRIPYDIYGFSGIPHLMLIGPDGTIISRGISVSQAREYLEEKTGEAGLSK